MQFVEGRIQLNDSETASIEDLFENNEGSSSLTRRDPGETGPVIVQIGSLTWEVDEKGNVEEVSN